MFIVHYAERSPRVTFLQIILNHHSFAGENGKPLMVDGAYGRNTRHAVKAASSALLKRTVDGSQASPDLITALLRGADLTIVSSVDLGDPSLLEVVDNLKAVGDDPIQLGAMCNGLGQLLTSVSAKADGTPILLLRLIGHGNLGRWLTLSVGAVAHMAETDPQGYADIEAEDRSYISASNFKKISSDLARLRPLFARFGFAEHLGCSLGKRGATRQMLESLADVWGVPITVNRGTQPISQSLDFATQTFTAFPRRHSLTTWSKQFQGVLIEGGSSE